MTLLSFSVSFLYGCNENIRNLYEKNMNIKSKLDKDARKASRTKNCQKTKVSTNQPVQQSGIPNIWIGIHADLIVSPVVSLNFVNLQHRKQKFPPNFASLHEIHTQDNGFATQLCGLYFQ